MNLVKKNSFATTKNNITNSIGLILGKFIQTPDLHHQKKPVKETLLTTYNQKDKQQNGITLPDY
jgi:hypothetical protein